MGGGGGRLGEREGGEGRRTDREENRQIMQIDLFQ